MSRKRKRLRPRGLLLLLLVAALAIGMAQGLDAAARRAIESSARDGLGVEAAVGRFSFGLVSGNSTLGDLVVPNPPGFPSDHLLRIGKGHAQVGPKALVTDRIEIPEMVLEDVDLRVEFGLKGANFQAVLDHLAQAGEPSGPRVAVKRLVLRNVSVTSQVNPLVPALVFDHDEIVLDDVGGEEGVPIGKLLGRVIEALAKR